MSLKDSEYEDVTTPRDGDSSESELEDSTSSKKKKRLVKHKPHWRYREMQSVVESLDMKIVWKLAIAEMQKPKRCAWK